MMEIINRKVISYCDIPDEYTEGSFLEDYPTACYVSYTININEDDTISQWIYENNPTITMYEEILIHIDY